MINSRDLNTFHVTVPLIHQTTDSKKQIGTTIISYEIRRYRELRNLTETFAYQILCTQRIVIPNGTTYSPGGRSVVTFSKYPGALLNTIAVTGANANAPCEIVSYSPRTLNSSVVTSVNNSNDRQTVATVQHSSGSSVSQSNSFGASATIGFFGDIANAGLSLNYERSAGTTRSKSASAGNELGSTHASASSDSMSVKDWGCYTQLNVADSALTWIWGQEYPWNIIQFRNDNGGESITLPDYVSTLLYDGAQIYPPSELSQFGIDFTMKALWIVRPASRNISFSHTMHYCEASHNALSGALNATIEKPIALSYPSAEIDLYEYGLDAISANGPSQPAIVGFTPRHFLVAPQPAAVNGGTLAGPTPFITISSGNNLLIEDATPYANLDPASDAGAGFSASETALTATFTKNCAALQMNISFKVADTASGYRLFMKHWKTGTAGIMANIVINGQTDSPIVKYIDTLEAEGGENNLLSLSLRNLNFGSVDYHDYLQLGLNTIEVTLNPMGGDIAEGGYQLRAISIESE